MDERGMGGKGRRRRDGSDGRERERKRAELTGSLSESLRSSLLSILTDLHESSHVVLGLVGLSCRDQSQNERTNVSQRGSRKEVGGR